MLTMNSDTFYDLAFFLLFFLACSCLQFVTVVSLLIAKKKKKGDVMCAITKVR